MGYGSNPRPTPDDLMETAEQVLDLAIEKLERHNLGQVRMRAADLTITVVAKGERAPIEDKD